jgi:glycosyltransferase involved in cell wall biosynthesis
MKKVREGTPEDVGAVVIGRNEGKHLAACLESLRLQVRLVVYVDSGSTDDSLAIARRHSAGIVELDTSIPFSAARARNEGFNALRRTMPGVVYVQFVDGDCEVAHDWIGVAAGFLRSHSDVAVACGRRRERYPDDSVFNLLCDIEWDTPIGEARACGGDALMRVDAFEGAKGFRENLIAGEEPELCLRLRRRGWRIWRLDAEMTRHDAAMTRLSQWWRRTVRTGYGVAQGVLLHGKGSERYLVREAVRPWAWAVLLPFATLTLGLFSADWFWLLMLYPLQIARLALAGARSSRENWIHAFFLVLGKFPETLGQTYFGFNRLAKKASRLIEYK